MISRLYMLFISSSTTSVRASYKCGIHSLCQCHFSIHLATKEATIVNLSSTMAFVHLPGQASYTLSKLAIAQLSAYIALENPNVRAVSVHSGTVMTDLLTPS
jgi:NAD(P)-dependent dehydrogenase (short-subunit alcohol dehydrogenase family)